MKGSRSSFSKPGWGGGSGHGCVRMDGGVSAWKGSEAGKHDAPAELTMSLQVLGCGPLKQSPSHPIRSASHLGGFRGMRESSGLLAHVLNWGLAWAWGPHPGTLAFRNLWPIFSKSPGPWDRHRHAGRHPAPHAPSKGQMLGPQVPDTSTTGSGRWARLESMGAGGSRTGLGSEGPSCRLPKSLWKVLRFQMSSST